MPGAPDVQALRHVLIDRRDTVTSVPQNRWLHDHVLHPVPGTKGKTYTLAAGIVPDLWAFDPEVFGISPREAGQMDPQQRLLLKVVWEALEDAGIPSASLSGRAVGVYIGCSAMGHASRLAQDAALTDAYLMTGNTLALVSNRISHVLDLRGPSMTVDTACSSSLYAMKLAEDALRSGEIDLAIVGAVNAILDPIHYIGFSAARMLSPTGKCRPFSAQADGYVRAEGAGAVILERSSLAALGPRRPHAELVAVGTNTDGRTLNVALPSVEGQAALLRQLYDRAGVAADELAFVEAHGTGTLAGDPVEAAALGRVLGHARTQPLVIGSVKSNIGHLEPASGIAGLMKALIALEDRIYPATLHASETNPAIELTALNLALAQDHVGFGRSDRAALAGVSSFGFGGANAHAILREVPKRAVMPAAAPQQSRQSETFLILSAFGEAALAQSMQAHAALIASDSQRDDQSLPVLSAQVAQYRGRYPHRAVVICPSPDVAQAALEAASEGKDDPRVFLAQSDLADAPSAFVFSGNGAQFAGIGLSAMALDPEYARGLRRIDRAYRAISSWSIIERMHAPDLEADLRDCAVAQPLLFADQMALFWALEKRGLTPAAVMGHSGGEVAAACASGALDLKPALQLIHARSHAMAALRGQGTMAAMQVSASEAQSAIEAFGAGVELAAENSPTSVTLVGRPERLDAFMRHARRAHRWPSVRLAIDYPYHSAAVDEGLPALREALADLKPKPTRIPFVSSVTGQVEPGETLDADYWCANARRPVAFLPAIKTLLDLGLNAFLEISPKPVLQSYISASLEPNTKCAVMAALDPREDDGINPVQRAVARALARGFRVQAQRLWPRVRTLRRDLPHYPWSKDELRIDRTPVLLNHYGNPAEAHPLLGREEGLGAGVWVCEIDQHNADFLCDHRLGGKVIMPGTALVEMALAAAHLALGTDRLELRDIDLLAPVVLGRSALVELNTRADKAGARVHIGARQRGTDGPHRLHLQTRMAASTVTGEPSAAPDPVERAGDRTSDRLYAAARRLGLDYGPGFAVVHRVRTLKPGLVEVFLSESKPLGRGGSRTLLDVIGTDAAFHGVIAALEDIDGLAPGMAYVPIRIARLEVLCPRVRVASARVEVLRVGKRSITARLALYDATGECVALLEGVRFQAVRLIRDQALESQSFRQIARPIDPTGADVPRLSVEAFADISHQPVHLPDDEGFFLLEATAQAIACEAVRGLAGPTGLIAATATWPTPYAAAVLAICERAETVEALPAGWRLTPRAAEADAEPMLRHLALAHPDLVAERALMLRLREVLPGLLVQEGDVPAPQTLFGREALANLVEGSAFTARCSAVLVSAVRSLATTWPKDRSLRIAEVTDGAARLLPGLLRQLPMADAEFCEIVVPMVDEPSAPLSLPQDQVTQIEPTPEAMAEAGPFDLVLAHGMLNRMRNPGAVLPQLVASMAQNAQLAVVEPAPSDFLDLIHGTDPAWFADLSDSWRPLARLLSEADLQGLASQTGVPNAQVMALPDGCGTASLLLAQAPERGVKVVPAAPELAAAALRLLTDNALAGRPFRCVDTAGHVLVLLPPTATDADPVAALSSRFLALRDLVADLATGDRRLVVLIPGGTGQAGPAHPGQTALWSLMRTAANEHPTLQMALYDLTPDLPAKDAARRIAALEATAALTAAPETELILRREGTTALRIVHGPGPVVADAGSDLCARLEARMSGGLDDMRWTLHPRKAPGVGEVEIAMAATGLNYRDVMWSMGLLPEEALEGGLAGPTIGIEGTGTILRVGPEVDGLTPGNQVLAFGPGLLASHCVLPAHRLTLLPKGMSAEAGATLPVAFFTAWYGLVTLANLRRGEWVLIHGGAGGVGLAAIQIAQMRGARVIATAGSAVKRGLLRAEGAEHVLDSRSMQFAEDVRHLTDGKGVDVVLNALAGPAMEASLGCLAPFGRFLELGKQDFYANTLIGLRALKDNIAYHGIDVDRLMEARASLASDLFDEIMQAFAAGDLRPLPHRVFDGESVVQAFRLMQKSGHIGKIVIRPPESKSLALSTAAFRADPDDVHVIVGGVGGLGIEVADWLISDAGARHLALVSRSAAISPDLASRLLRWRGQGAEVQVIACDVADAAALDRCLTALRAKRRIAGVIHSAMVLEDMPMARIDADVLARTLPAKVAGGENLDRLTRVDGLDYFVVFTSLATLIGNHGQSAYVAANGYLEGVVRRRRAEGLPGHAIGWGGISDAGYLARDPEKATLVRRMSGNVEFTALQAMRALDRILALGNAADPVLHVSPMGWNAVSVTLRTLTAPAYQLLRRLGRREETDSTDLDLRELLLGLPLAKAEARLTAWLIGRVAHILQVPEQAIGVTRSVSDLGIDSLMGVELGLTLQESLGDDVPTSLVSDALSISEIAARITRHLHGNPGGESDSNDALRLVAQHLGIAHHTPHAEAAE